MHIGVVYRQLDVRVSIALYFLLFVIDGHTVTFRSNTCREHECVCVCLNVSFSTHLELVDSLAVLTTEVAQLDTEIADLFPQHHIRAHFI